MSAVLVSKENNRAVFTVEIAKEKFEEAVNQAYFKNRVKFNIPGFRKGKAPRKILEMNFGEGLFFEDAVNALLPDAYDQAVEELKLDPVDSPQVDIEEIDKEKPLKIKFEVDLKPIPVLGDYKNLVCQDVHYPVEDNDIQRVIDNALEANSRIITVEDRKSKNGDILTIDFEGYVDGKSFKGGKSENHELILGSNSFIPGFEEQLLDKAAKEEVEVNVKFPEYYHEKELASKEAQFHVVIQSIKEKQKPDLDDEFVKDISEFDTLDTYMASIKENLEKENQVRERAEKENNAIEALIQCSDIIVPNSMVESQIDHEFKEFTYRLKSMGLDMDQYYRMTNTDEKHTREQLRDTAEKRVKADLAIDALVQAENIKVTDEELDEELNQIVSEYKSEDPEKFKEDIKKSGDIDFIKGNVARRKAIDTLVAMTTFVEKSAEDTTEEKAEESVITPEENITQE